MNPSYVLSDAFLSLTKCSSLKDFHLAITCIDSSRINYLLSSFRNLRHLLTLYIDIKFIYIKSKVNGKEIADGLQVLRFLQNL